KVEDINDVDDYSLLSARWIKPPHCGSPGQRVAHPIINATTVESINNIIRSGMLIAERRVFGRKLI
ncbi:hypothetical protein M422DRAFT_156191, partial [Sphaerobolus stellatus SS14]